MSKEFEWTITPHDCGRRQIFVKGYKKADGTEVKSYCRGHGDDFKGMYEEDHRYSRRRR